MRTERIWKLPDIEQSSISRLSASCGISTLMARLLLLRGIDTPEAVHTFLNPSISRLHNPFELTGVDVAVGRMLTAIERDERIAIHGDYDADGITSTVILRRVLEMLDGDVVHFIPERIRDGYGLQSVNIERLHSQDVRVIISVDCGIRSSAAGQRAQELGIDLIITDHHEPEESLPKALAVINPKRVDCPYPNKDLAGVGVTLKLVQALCMRVGREEWIPGFLKLAAIGTVADVVPLRNENRIIAHVGLALASEGPNSTGLEALLAVSGLRGKKLRSSDIAFGLAPRLNAAGRMSSPDIAARLLLTNRETLRSEADSLAQQLDDENTRRRHEETALVERAKEYLSSHVNVSAQTVLVIAGNEWHRGVIGIVASRLAEEYGKPVVLLSIEGDIAHGSGRSIGKFDLLGCLESCSNLFERFGGHQYAAGLVIPVARIDELRSRMNEFAVEHLSTILAGQELIIDADLELDEINEALLNEVRQLEPFGNENRSPVFRARGVEVVNGPRIVKNQHVSMTVKQGKCRFRAMAWKFAKNIDRVMRKKNSVDITFSLSENLYRGNRSIELSVNDVK